MPRRDGDDKAKSGLTAAGSDFFQLVVEYAKQETLGPLKNLGRFVALGVAGSLALAAGAVFLLLAGLRAIQTETGSTFTGNLSWLPYVITAAGATIVALLAAWRITKGSATRSVARPREGRALTMATATTKITRDDLEAKLREMSGGVEDKVEQVRPTLITTAVAGALLALLVAYLLGRRRGRARSAVVEIRKV